MDFHFSLIEATETLLKQTVAPQANAIDHDPIALGEALQALGHSSLLALRVSQRWGGAGVDESTFRQFQELVARYSGALAFLQAQHQSAAGSLLRSENVGLQQAYLPDMVTGKRLVGISFAHLRRRDVPVGAIAVPGGYEISGQAPWVTGHGFFQSFILAAALPDGQAVYGMMPFQTQYQTTGGKMVCSQPMALAAMSSTRTVTVDLGEWFLPESDVVGVYALAGQEQSDRRNVLQHSFSALGCARAGLDILHSTDRQKELPFLQIAHQLLSQELTDCRQAIFAAQVEDFEQNLYLRSQAIELAVRCAHAAVAASSGAANHSQHPAQRVYREALVYTVAGQTLAVMQATLERLTDQTKAPSQQH